MYDLYLSNKVKIHRTEVLGLRFSYGLSILWADRWLDRMAIGEYRQANFISVYKSQ